MRKIFLVGALLMFELFTGYCQEPRTSQGDWEKGNYNSCQVDADCILFEPNCCPRCEPGESIHKDSLNQVGLEKKERCSSFVGICKNIECEPKLYEPYCNEQKLCDSRINCVRSCQLVANQDRELARKITGCVCQ